MINGVFEIPDAVKELFIDSVFKLFLFECYLSSRTCWVQFLKLFKLLLIIVVVRFISR